MVANLVSYKRVYIYFFYPVNYAITNFEKHYDITADRGKIETLYRRYKRVYIYIYISFITPKFLKSFFL